MGLPQEYQYDFVWDFKSSPEELWPLVSDTNRFNRDTDIPEVTGSMTPDENLHRPVSFTTKGVTVAWQEHPFEWVRNRYFTVTREYTSGPIGRFEGGAYLEPLPEGGTRLTYKAHLKPASPLGNVLIPIQIGVVCRRDFEKAIRVYDEAIQQRLAHEKNASKLQSSMLAPPPEVKLTKGQSARLQELVLALHTKTQSPWAEKLEHVIRTGDELMLSRMRAYELADDWNAPRKDVLELMLEATQLGLLDLSWNLLCPLCRGAKKTADSLKDVVSNTHCGSCQIDFSVNFDQSVEINFRPNKAVRELRVEEFCIGSPQRTPHVIAQSLLEPGTEKTLALDLLPGRYRLRARQDNAGMIVVIGGQSGQKSLRLENNGTAWENPEPSPDSDIIEVWPGELIIQLANQSSKRQLFIAEEVNWNDAITSAAEITSLQKFRDLFSSEALRPEEKISVGNLTVVFTDLKDSTALYRAIGDAPAFGSVMSHFDVLREAIAFENGAIVKTMGDAVMAVFTQPAQALRAMLKAQKELSRTPLNGQYFTLKVGIHQGPCIAVNLNERLDYFGSTVNIAARLQSISAGNDMVLSDEICADMQVRDILQGMLGQHVEPLRHKLKGFGEEEFQLVRVRQGIFEKPTREEDSPQAHQEAL